ncbi:unnamed protein product [Cyclocybe aegerita]|uniref:Peregrin n=1 Tax=Cyclocybe aegerita TaxID=1973307 RepID=A0A8S0VRY7_CYCAE|nr:unnamed protein product [Cyclocybe aegerita]
MMIYMAFASLQILLVQSIPEGGPMGMLNGVAQMLSSGTRSIAPTFASSLFSVSLQRQLLGGNLVYLVLISLVLAGIQAAKFLSNPPEKKENRRSQQSTVDADGPLWLTALYTFRTLPWLNHASSYTPFSLRTPSLLPPFLPEEDYPQTVDHEELKDYARKLLQFSRYQGDISEDHVDVTNSPYNELDIGLPGNWNEDDFSATFFSGGDLEGEEYDDPSGMEDYREPDTPCSRGSVNIYSLRITYYSVKSRTLQVTTRAKYVLSRLCRASSLDVVHTSLLLCAASNDEVDRPAPLKAQPASATLLRVPTPSKERNDKDVTLSSRKMARGHHHHHHHAASPAASALPKVEFEIAKDDVMKLPAGVHEAAPRAYGYNDFSEFRRPDHYIRHIEPLESDLAKLVEYDMDEQDQEWLEAVNADRKKDQMDKVSLEVFEIMMDRLEKEWFDLTKNIPKQDFAMPSEDSTCAVCDDSEGENSNAIVFCDGCNLAVHQECYGVPYIPEGQWLCRKCTVSPENPVSCMLCPNEGGAFKQTTHGDWVHLLCAIWIPETRVANDVFMEPITGADRISKQRWKLRCSVCEVRAGACIQCTKPSCFVAFHATCARKEKLLMPMKSAQGAEPASLMCFCDRHLPQEQQDARQAALEAEEEQEANLPPAAQSKSARAYAKTYKPGPPLVPALIVDRIMEHTYRIRLRKKLEFVQQLCRYWGLKREARRGAPLLKRLHLEPWTASSAAKVLSREERLMRLDQLQRLRQDLVCVREMTELSKRRESRKMRQVEIVCEVLMEAFFPHVGAMRIVFDKIVAMDKSDHFKMPVSKRDVPDYFDVIKKPMCWDIIDAMLEQNRYWDLQNFLDDVNLVLDNALLYNKSGSPFYRLATRIHKDSRPLLASLEKWRVAHPPVPSASKSMPNGQHHTPTGPENEGENAEAEQAKFEDGEIDPPQPLVGDLEPPMAILELLLSPAGIAADLNIELEGAPIESLFNYELARVKPPPPDSPTVMPVPSPEKMEQKEQAAKNKASRTKKPKKERDRKAEARARAEAAAAATVEAAKAQQDKGEKAVEADDEGEDEEQEGRGNEMERPREDRSRDRGRDRELQAALDASAGFRAPRTRSALAAAAAFEAEATRGSSPVASPSVIALPRPALPLTVQDAVASSTSTPANSESPGSKPVSKSKKRPSIVTMGQPGSPRVVSDVDNRDSFSLFNAGWILPPDQKRGGRTSAADRDRQQQQQVLSPPRKKQKIDRPASRLSVVSTAASDNQTLRRTPPFSSDPPEMKHHPEDTMDVPMDVDAPEDYHGEASAGRQYSSDEFEVDEVNGPHHVVTLPNGDIIIEKLDTPAIRREKSMRKKVEKQQKQAVLTAVVDPGTGVPDEFLLASNVPQSKGKERQLEHEEDLSAALLPSADDTEEDKNAGAGHDGDESELSELSDETEDEDAIGDEEVKEVKEEKKKPPPKKIPAPRAPRPKRTKKPPRVEQFEDGTIVWAKSESFPWWPAVVYANENDAVPQNILEAHRIKRQKRKIKLFIVQFYDKQKSWQSVARDKLQLLGEDSKLDQQMLSSTSTLQKWKTPASKKECREAYRQAFADMDHGSRTEGTFKLADDSDDH